ncbi:glycosyltransferase family 2 protein, partial [bacterium]|nr:glycosyltransferase family 2 protein [bacterium]
MTPDISIVMPTFGQSKYITESLQSIVAQEFENWELVVVIDGEDTETEKILKLWTANDDRIKYITKLNGGTGSALNYGFFQTGGRYETWFASDNKMYPNCLRV